MLELDVSPRHSKCPLIDDLVVASAMKGFLDQGARSLAPHRFEAPYCKECYCEIIHSGKHTLFGVRVIINQALPQNTMISQWFHINLNLSKKNSYHFKPLALSNIKNKVILIYMYFITVACLYYSSKYMGTKTQSSTLRFHKQLNKNSNFLWSVSEA